MTHELPSLPFAAAALEPHIDARTIELHYTRHHQNYVSRLNNVLAAHPGLRHQPAAQLLTGLVDVPRDIRATVRQCAGGHHNHSLLWTWMTPDGGGRAQGPLARALDAAFGGFADFQRRFAAAAALLEGSGWVWLALHRGVLEIATTANQDSLLLHGKTPILGVDLWEHAYYLRYQDRRDEYVDAWWRVVNWDAVARGFAAARGGSARSGASLRSPTWYLRRDGAARPAGDPDQLRRVGAV